MPVKFKLNPNSEAGNAIEKTCREPIAVGRVTPCATRLQPACANFSRHRVSNPLPGKAFPRLPVPTPSFRLNRLIVRAFVAVAVFFTSALADTPDIQQIISAHADDFNSGSPEAKNIWDGLIAAVNSSDHAAEQTALEQLRNVSDLSGNQLAAIRDVAAAVEKQPSAPAAAAAQSGNAPLPLKVVGNKILNPQGEPVWLRGVNTASLEWSSDGQGRILETVRTAIRDWHVNLIRLPLSQDRWFGKGPEQTDGGDAYRALIHQIVNICATNQCYVILDLHWSDCGEWGSNIGQHSMPDSNSVAFWKDCAPVYANQAAVLFDLYNEPHDVTWEVWLHGGIITDQPNHRQSAHPRTYEAVGLQLLLDTIRATGAKNVVIAGGLNWAYDFSGILAGRQLADPAGDGVIYANHCYDDKNDSVAAWLAKMEAAAAKLPVIVTEFGEIGGAAGPGKAAASNDWLRQVLAALENHHWSWVAWDLHPGAGPKLISDWNYTPTETFGVPVKQALSATPPLAPEVRPDAPPAKPDTTSPP